MGLRIPCSAGASQSHPLHLLSIHGSSPTGGARHFKHVPPATSIEHDVRMFSMLAAWALHARQLPGAIFRGDTYNRRLIENSLLSVSCCLSLLHSCFLVSFQPFPFSLFENFAMVHFFIIPVFVLITRWCTCSRNAALVAVHVFRFLFFLV